MRRKLRRGRPPQNTSSPPQSVNIDYSPVMAVEVAVFRDPAVPVDSGDGRVPSSLNYFLGEAAGQIRIVPSQLPLATVCPSGANATQLRNTPSSCLVCPSKV